MNAEPRFYIYRASAGTGKTYTLVRQYIEIAISTPSKLNSRFKHILAITFTNKAANGMKERILSTLNMIVKGNEDVNDMRDEIANHLAITKEEVLSRCRVVRSAILHNYSDFAVCTIDSFVHRLVRSFAYELHLPINFNVLINNSEVIQSIVDNLLASAGNEEERSLTDMLCAFIENNMEDGRTFKLEKSIVNMAKEIFREESPEFLDALKDYDFNDFVKIRQQLIKDNKSFEAKLSAAAAKAIDACRVNGLYQDSFPQKSKGIYPYFERLAKGDVSKMKPNSIAEGFLESGVLSAKNTPQEIVAAIESATSEILHAYGHIKELLKKELPLYNTRCLLIANIYTMALLNRLSLLKDDYYKENELVHISEFNKSIAKVLDESALFIYERIGGLYYNYLIDEFQDTSRLQWQNFLPLIDEAMSWSYGGDTAQPGMRSMVVGDGKQAIYRFRQGDVRQFMMLPEVTGEHGRLLKGNHKIEPLYKNYRTLETVVKFNNDFFEWVVKEPFQDNELLTKLYIYGGETPSPDDGTGRSCDLQQLPNKKGGYVNVGFYPKDNMLSAVLDIIRKQKALDFSYNDMLVLARKNDTLVEIANYLTSNGIDVVSAESFILMKSRAVLLMKYMLKYLLDTSDRSSAVQIVQLYADLHCDENIDVDNCLWHLKDSKYDIHKVFQKLNVDLNCDYLRSLSLYDCCEHIVRCMRIGNCDTAYVASFLNVVASFSQFHRHDLSELITYLDDNLSKLSVSTAGDSQAVQLMTVHKAKGLESKIVIFAIPDTVSPQPSIWVNLRKEQNMPLPVAYFGLKKEMPESLFDEDVAKERRMEEMDEINVLYVAMTRPKEKMFVVCEKDLSDEKERSESKNPHTYINLLYSYLTGYKKQQAVESELGTSFEFGDDVKSLLKQEKSDIGKMIVDDIVFPSWEDRIDIADQNESLLESVMGDSRRYGIMVHDILAHIATEDDLDYAMKEYAEIHELDAEDCYAVRERIVDMLNDEDNRRFFKPSCKVMREVPMMINGQRRRPDRIVFFEDETWVIDFKTGTPDQESKEKYKTQIMRYASALHEMGYPNVRWKLIYL